MDFNCNFDRIDFCHYSNQGWGFQKSTELVTQQIINQKLNSLSNNQKIVPIYKNYFPCANSTSQNVPILKKLMEKNSTQQICLQFSYLIDNGGFITINNGRENWTDRQSISDWRNVTVTVGSNKPILEKQKPTASKKPPTTSRDFIKISGRQVCLDNLATVPVSQFPGEICPSLPKFNNKGMFGNINNGNNDNNGKSGIGGSGGIGNFNSISGLFKYWLSQPISVLIVVVAVVIMLFLLGLLFSVLFSRTKSKPASSVRKSGRRNRSHFGHSPGSGGGGGNCGENHHLNSTMLTLDDGATNMMMAHHHHHHQECCYHHANGRHPTHATSVNSGSGAGGSQLPALVHARQFKNNGNGAPCCSNGNKRPPGGNNVALRSQSSTSQSPQCRFSLALTEDAQLTLLSNEQLNQQTQAPAVNSNHGVSLVNNTTATTTMSLSSINSSSSSSPSVMSHNNSSNNGSHSNGIQGNISQYSNSYHGNTSNPSYNDSIINHTVIEENEQSLNDGTTTTIANGNHSPSPLSRTGQPARPNSILLLPAHFHTPLINDAVSDTNSNIVAIDNTHEEEEEGNGSHEDGSANHGSRTRPICETLNIGYVSDGSLCEHLPHYDAALQLLARAANQDSTAAASGSRNHDDDETLHDGDDGDASDDDDGNLGDNL